MILKYCSYQTAMIGAVFLNLSDKFSQKLSVKQLIVKKQLTLSFFYANLAKPYKRSSL